MAQFQTKLQLPLPGSRYAYQSVQEIRGKGTESFYWASNPPLWNAADDVQALNISTFRARSDIALPTTRNSARCFKDTPLDLSTANITHIIT